MVRLLDARLLDKTGLEILVVVVVGIWVECSLE